MFKIILFLIGVSNVYALKCHVCETVEDPDCYEMENKAKTAFLQECHPDETKCVLLIDIRIPENIKRKCMKPDWKCNSNFKCQNCTTDGCNEGVEIKEEDIIGDIEEVRELLIANIYVIAVIVFLVLVLIMWCIIKMCSKRKDVYYEEEEYEDDFAVYYENQVDGKN